MWGLHSNDKKREKCFFTQSAAPTSKMGRNDVVAGEKLAPIADERGRFRGDRNRLRLMCPPRKFKERYNYMRKGIFITLEGLDGSGKSTQALYIKDFLEERGYEVLLTREPGGTEIGEKIRQILLDKKNKEMSAITEALLYAASRAQHVEQVIVPALEDGKIVLCDRFIDSSIAYQGKGRELGLEAVMDINKFATCGLVPDITILLDMDPEASLNRIKTVKGTDRLEQEKLDFHRRVYEGYRDLANMYPDRIRVIDANKTVGEIGREIENKLDSIIRKG
ncbi:MAG: dTMP kinase [Candidatus Alkaliphilus sp. MAG34]